MNVFTIFMMNFQVFSRLEGLPNFEQKMNCEMLYFCYKVLPLDNFAIVNVTHKKYLLIVLECFSEIEIFYKTSTL